MGSSRQQTWCHKTIMAKNNHYSGNFLLLRPGGNRCKPQSSYIQQKNQSLPAKCWAQSRQRSESGSEPVQSSSKTCVWNLSSLTHVIQNRYSIQEPIIYGKTTRDLHMLHANKLQRPQLYFFSFFASNLPHSVTLKHFFTCGACSPQIWMNFAYVTWFFLHSWHIVARMNSCNFSALSRNFFSQLLRIFSQLLRIFSQLLRVHISQEFLRLYFEFLRLYF